MDAIKIPTQKPVHRKDLELPIAQLSGLASDISRRIMTAQLEILNAGSAEELAMAIAKLYGALADSTVSWGDLANQTRHWSR